jgi:hypothetical protein
VSVKTHFQESGAWLRHQPIKNYPVEEALSDPSYPTPQAGCEAQSGDSQTAVVSTVTAGFFYIFPDGKSLSL